jgi:hypothetical protein
MLSARLPLHGAPLVRKVLRDAILRNGQLGLLAREIPADIPRLMQSVGGLSAQNPGGGDL